MERYEIDDIELHWSHPSQGAWIEITLNEFMKSNDYSRTLHRVRGLK